MPGEVLKETSGCRKFVECVSNVFQVFIKNLQKTCLGFVSYKTYRALLQVACMVIGSSPGRLDGPLAYVGLSCDIICVCYECSFGSLNLW